MIRVREENEGMGSLRKLVEELQDVNWKTIIKQCI